METNLLGSSPILSQKLNKSPLDSILKLIFEKAIPIPGIGKSGLKSSHWSCAILLMVDFLLNFFH